MDFIAILSIFVLACFVGYYVVWSVTPALHTPLMAVTNAISSVIVVGALLAVDLAAHPGDLLVEPGGGGRTPVLALGVDLSAATCGRLGAGADSGPGIDTEVEDDRLPLDLGRLEGLAPVGDRLDDLIDEARLMNDRTHADSRELVHAYAIPGREAT